MFKRILIKAGILKEIDPKGKYILLLPHETDGARAQVVIHELDHWLQDPRSPIAILWGSGIVLIKKEDISAIAKEVPE